MQPGTETRGVEDQWLTSRGWKMDVVLLLLAALLSSIAEVHVASSDYLLVRIRQGEKKFRTQNSAKGPL